MKPIKTPKELVQRLQQYREDTLNRTYINPTNREMYRKEGFIQGIDESIEFVKEYIRGLENES
jgi:hypothetical protein